MATIFSHSKQKKCDKYKLSYSTGDFLKLIYNTNFRAKENNYINNFLPNYFPKLRENQFVRRCDCDERNFVKIPNVVGKSILQSFFAICRNLNYIHNDFQINYPIFPNYLC